MMKIVHHQVSCPCMKRWNIEQNFTEHILITGGAGYIATHTIVCLLEAGYDVSVIDNLVNSSPESLKRIKKILSSTTGLPFVEERLRFYEVDLCDKAALEEVFKNSPSKFTACVHFAGLKAVGESVAKPLLYYENNLGKSTHFMLAIPDPYERKYDQLAEPYGQIRLQIHRLLLLSYGIYKCTLFVNLPL